MKRKEFRDQVRGMGEPELREKARSVSEELMKLRFRKVAGQLQQTHRLGELKRQLAQCLTALRQKAGLQQKTGSEGSIEEKTA